MTNTRKTWIKICGITRLEDALTAASLGIDALGFVFTPSKRRIAPEDAREIRDQLPQSVTSVGVFRDQSVDDVNATASHVRLDLVQLHGSESPAFCRDAIRPVIKTICVKADDTPDTLRRKMDGYAVWAFLLDPGAGDGIPFAWKIAKSLRGRLIIAGGLTPETVGNVIQTLSPFGVDVSSGVEIAPGHKDRSKMERLITEAR